MLQFVLSHFVKALLMGLSLFVYDNMYQKHIPKIALPKTLLPETGPTDDEGVSAAVGAKPATSTKSAAQHPEDSA